MKKLIATKDLSVEEWLHYRRQGIGGSDASTILGVNPYNSILRLWEDKTGRYPVEEMENEYTHFGHVMEPVIRREFERRTGYRVRRSNFILQSTEHPFMLADLDGTTRDKEGNICVFEAKTASEYKRPVWEKGIPDEYMAQLQHYLLVTGYPKAYICAVVGGNSFYCHEIHRDEAYMDRLLLAEKKFWDCVVSGLPPKPDGSASTSAFLGEKYKNGKREEIFLPGEAERLAEAYGELEKDIRELKTRKEEISNQLKAMLGENEKGRTQNHVVSWTTIIKRTADVDKVKERLGNAYDDCLKESRYRKFSVA